MSQTAQPYTEDYLFGGRLLVRQPAQGYRIAIDPLFLAAAVHASAGDTVLDVGAGVGAASLCLATRLPDVKVVGLEVARDLVRLGSDNILTNSLRGRVEILHGDLTSPPPRLSPGSYAHIMTNPPYYEKCAGRLSPYVSKAVSNHHNQVPLTLEMWMRFCLTMVKPKGTVTLIHRPERLDEILSYCYGKLGDIKVIPLWPGKGKPAKRVLIQGIKGSAGDLKLYPGLTLHGNSSSYTPEAEGILRHAQPLSW